MSRIAGLTQLKERATRGKYAEDKVRDELKALSDRRAYFDFERNYDARSSMGRIPRRAGDFTFYTSTGHGVIEVKQVNHEFRLPKKNFNPDGFGVLRKRALAGGKIIVLVFHTPTRIWRYIPFEWFDERRDQTSWVLSDFREFQKPADALYMAGLH
jgi:hypothetical protein